MKKSRKDPVREDRIHNAIVDAGPEERAPELVLLPGRENPVVVQFEPTRQDSAAR